MLFESLTRLTEKRDCLNHAEIVWLIDAINNKLNLEGKEKLYSLLVVFNKQQMAQSGNFIYDPKEPFYEIKKIHPRLQLVWFGFVKMHLKSQVNDKRRKNVADVTF
jgi:hypothetical protein